MRRTFARITLTAAATAGLAATTALHALGLGEINVDSNLNQRFVASIPLTEISAEDLETVTVTLAPNEVYERAGVERSDYLSSLDFSIKNDRGRPRVVVTSSQIAKEPVIDLLLQARWKGGKIVREYTVLLDPAETVAARPAPVAPPVAAVAAPVIAKPAPAKPGVPVGGEFYEPAAPAKPVIAKPAKPAADAGAPAFYDPAYDSATGSYGPVAPKETLWSIATKVRPSPRVTMDQVLLALAEANPVAIQNGTTVSKGAVLRVPSAERIGATAPAAAKARLQALRGGQPVVSRATAKPARPAGDPIIATPATPAAEKPATAPPAPAKTTSSSLPDLPKPQIALPPQPATVPPPAPAASTSQPASTAPAPTAPASTATAPATVTPATADPAATAAASPATTTPAAPAATPPATAPAKSPLAQPLPEPDSPGFIEEYGLPLLAALILALLAGAAFVLAKRKKEAKPAADFTGFKPGDTSTVIAPAGGAGALARLGDSSTVSDDTQRMRAPELGAAAIAAGATQQLTQPVDVSSAQQSTLILDPETVAALNSSVKASAATGNTAGGFDRTTQIQVDALNIDLGDNDPLSEADFHLAYGLYDEAILLLTNASAKEPQRTDLKVKLAETYFAAGRPMEFQETAEDLKASLSPAEWSKIAIMGSQICPDVAIFKGDGGSDALDADFDLAFDEPASPAPAPAVAAPAGNRVEFSLDMPVAAPAPTPGAARLELPGEYDDEDKEHSLATSLPPAGLDDNASIDFMLGQSLTPLGAGTKVPEPADLSFNLGSPSLNVEMPKIENPKLSSGIDQSINQRATLAPATDVISLSLQDLEVSITPRQNSNESVEDDLNTKLDLARAYVEMGDTDMAKSLLQEVQQQGSERHQKEAQSLLQRLPA